MWIACAFALSQHTPLDSALALIQRNHMLGDDTALITKKVLAGALRALDPYSAYFPPAQYRQIKQMTQGVLCGIGLELLEHDGKIIVQTVIPGSPAKQVGINPGDIITHIDGEKIAPFTPQDVIIAKMNGKPGTKIIISTQKCHMAIRRQQLKIPTIVGRKTKNRLYIRVRYFADSTSDELRHFMHDHLDASRIILDLRFNPGGSIKTAVETAGIFLDSAPIVHVKSRMTVYNKTYICQGKALCPRTPLIVLINRNTASSAEIIAAALKDHKRAIIVGERSLGKGCIQDFFDLPGHGGIKLTVGRFYSPDGHAIQDCGVTPHRSLKVIQ